MMEMEQLEDNGYRANANLMANVLIFLGNHAQHEPVRRRILVVEGATDKKFMDKFLLEEINCLEATNLIEANNAFLGNQPYRRINHKQIIIQTFSLQRAVPQNLQDSILFGVVDSDGQAPDSYRDIPRLFQTDTSDLETLILWSDSTILSRICQNPQEPVANFVRAFRLAYQVSLIKRCLIRTLGAGAQEFNLDLSQAQLRAFSDLDNGSFNIIDCVFSLLKSAHPHATRGQAIHLIQQMIQQNNADFRNILNPDTLTWRRAVLTRPPENLRNFWNIVNGHILLDFLNIVCPDCFPGEQTHEEDRYNRNFEYALIENYRTDNFQTTTLYNNLNEVQLMSI